MPARYDPYALHIAGAWVAFALVLVTVVAALFLPRKREESHLLDDDDQADAVPVIVH